MAIARYYVGNPETDGYFPGVPTADLEQETYDALPDHVKASVDASSMYKKSKPRADADHVAAHPAPATKEEK